MLVWSVGWSVGWLVVRCWSLYRALYNYKYLHCGLESVVVKARSSCGRWGEGKIKLEVSWSDDVGQFDDKRTLSFCVIRVYSSQQFWPNNYHHKPET